MTPLAQQPAHLRVHGHAVRLQRQVFGNGGEARRVDPGRLGRIRHGGIAGLVHPVIGARIVGRRQRRPVGLALRGDVAFRDQPGRRQVMRRQRRDRLLLGDLAVEARAG